MDALTIHEAASTTGWSARMLRYVEDAGLIEPQRSAAGYRLYGPEELQRLRTLRELLDSNAVSITEVGFALRLRREPLNWPMAEIATAAQAAIGDNPGGQRPDFVALVRSAANLPAYR